MGNQESVVPIVVQETGMVATTEEYHSGSVVRAVAMALGIITILVLGGIARKHYGIFQCLTQSPQYSGATRRDSYFSHYISRGRVRTDVENQLAPQMVLHGPPPTVFMQPATAPPIYSPPRSQAKEDSKAVMTGLEQFARL